MRAEKEKVAVVGSGPGGLVVARYLKGQGFKPILFESRGGIGGQWDWANAKSGVWPTMPINTIRTATCFSDIDYPDQLALFPKNTEVLDYLKSYAKKFSLLNNVRLHTRVTRAARAAKGGYEVTSISDSKKKVERFAEVVVATGRFNKPEMPEITGVESFSGKFDFKYAFKYKRPEIYRKFSLLVLGGSISSLEIATDQVLSGASKVYLVQRRERYVTPKMIAGYPLEYFVFICLGYIANRKKTAAGVAEDSEAFMLKYTGDPSRYGVPAPDPDFALAGVTGSQHYLNLVGYKMIDVRPWPKNISVRRVTFEDGTSVEVDGIIAGTGFELNLPFLSDEIHKTLNASSHGLELANFTFHPELPGLAFIGLWSQLGPYLVSLEQQAYYLTYAWSGAINPPSLNELEAGIEACREERHHEGYRVQIEMIMRFAKLCGTDPVDLEDKELATAALASAAVGKLFRLVGPDAAIDAGKRLKREVRRFAPPVDFR